LLQAKLDALETDLKTLRGDGGLGQVYGNLDMNHGRCVNASPSKQQSDYVTRGELEDAMGAQLFYQIFSIGGTTYTLNSQAAWVLPFVNGGLMELGATGNMGYTVDLDGGSGRKTKITTNRSLATTDFLLVLYVKAAL
jgi:hypothetical protein